jgi:hypothetical protein
VESDLLPPDPKYVRAQLDYACYLFEPQDSGAAVRVSFLANFNFMVDLPQFVSDLVISANGLHLSNIKNMIKDMSMNAVPNIEFVFRCISECDGEEFSVLEDHHKAIYLAKEKEFTEENEEKSTQTDLHASIQTDSSKETQTYKSAIHAAIDKLYAASESYDWRYVTQSQDVKIYQANDKDDPKSCVVMGTGLVDADALAILCLLCDTENKLKWDQNVEKCEVITEVDPITQITYEYYKAIWPTSPRELVCVSSFKILENGTIIAVATSTNHPKYPETSECVRMILHYGGFIISPCEAHKCEVKYVMNLDLCGNIPSYLAKRIITQQPIVIETIRMALKNSELTKNYNSKTLLEIWNSFKSHDGHDKANDPNRSVKIEESALRRSSIKAIRPTSTSEKLMVEQNVDALYRNISHIESVDEALIDFLEAFDNEIKWEFLYEKSSVQVFQKRSLEYLCPITRAVGYIEASPRDLAVLLSQIDRRRWFDSYLTTVDMIEEIDANTKVS